MRGQHQTTRYHENHHIVPEQDIQHGRLFSLCDRPRRLVQFQADQQHGAQNGSSHPGHQTDSCPVKDKSGSGRHENITDRSPQSQLPVPGHVALHFRKNQSIRQRSLCASEQIDGDHEKGEIPETAAEKKSGESDQCRSRRKLEHACTLPRPVGHPPPQIRPDDSHGLHQ